MNKDPNFDLSAAVENMIAAADEQAQEDAAVSVRGKRSTVGRATKETPSLSAQAVAPPRVSVSVSPEEIKEFHSLLREFFDATAEAFDVKAPSDARVKPMARASARVAAKYGGGDGIPPEIALAIFGGICVVPMIIEGVNKAPKKAADPATGNPLPEQRQTQTKVAEF